MLSSLILIINFIYQKFYLSKILFIKNFIYQKLLSLEPIYINKNDLYQKYINN